MDFRPTPSNPSNLSNPSNRAPPSDPFLISPSPNVVPEAASPSLLASWSLLLVAAPSWSVDVPGRLLPLVSPPAPKCFCFRAVSLSPFLIHWIVKVLSISQPSHGLFNVTSQQAVTHQPTYLGSWILPFPRLFSLFFSPARPSESETFRFLLRHHRHFFFFLPSLALTAVNPTVSLPLGARLPRLSSAVWASQESANSTEKKGVHAPQRPVEKGPTYIPDLRLKGPWLPPVPLSFRTMPLVL